MNTDSGKQIIKNIIWNGISILITALINIILTPVITRNIGIEANGFVDLANTCVTYIDIITVALNAFAARYIAIEYHNGNYKEANKFYSSVAVADLILAVLLFVPCSAMVWKLQFILNISDNLVSDVKLLFFLVLLKWCINVTGTVFSVSAFIKNKTSITYRNSGISALINAFTLAGLIYFTKIHVYYMAAGSLAAAIVNLWMNLHCTKYLTPELQIHKKDFSFEKVKKLLSSGIWNSINNIGNMLNSGLDLLVCNKLLSGVVMGQVSISKMIGRLMTLFTNVMVSAFQPKQLEAYAKGETERLVDYLKVAMKSVAIAGNVFFVCFVVLGKNFLELWIPGQDNSRIFTLTVIVIIGDILVTVVRPLFYVYTLTDNLKAVCWITICSGVLNVISMFLLIANTKLGGYAVVGTTTVLNLIVHFWTAPYFAGRYLKIKMSIFLKIIFRHIAVCFVVTGLFYFISVNLVVNSWMNFVKYGFLFGAGSFLITSALELERKEIRTVMRIIYFKIKTIRR
ncbi:MAG: lipopolysaccharide biosynthesis protein [Lachnospiraceae bacterium]|jgi:Membrane protein involved in the export of O-antigen and teichoic acid|nr:lipopolysaccharide biosynthesis protein [Lachnospiraceae bacterium]